MIGNHLNEGGELLAVGDISTMRARIYISEYEMQKIHSGAMAKLQMNGIFGTTEAETIAVSQRPSQLDPRAGTDPEQKETKPFSYYVVDILVPNPVLRLKSGMSGTARVYGRRRSLGGLGLESVLNFWSRKLW
jgi:hypothetical protein